MAQALSQDVQRKKSGSLCLTKISNFITGSMDKGFYWWVLFTLCLSNNEESQ